MGLTPLTVAGVATALLVVSVGFDIAYSQTLTVELQQDGEWRTVAKVSLDTDQYQGFYGWREGQNVTRDDVIQGRVRLDNGYPWPSSKTVDVRARDCYQDEGHLASVPVSAPASAVGEGTFEVRVADLQDDTGYFREPVPAKQNVTYALVHFCKGERAIGSVSLPIVEGSS